MSYIFHRVFCAPPPAFEEKRPAFPHLLGEFNADAAMPRGVLMVGVSLVPQMTDKRPYQGVVNENIADARYYILVIEDSWGAPQRNFERDWAVARQYAADPAKATTEAVMLFRKPLLPHRVEPDIAALKTAQD